MSDEEIVHSILVCSDNEVWEKLRSLFETHFPKVEINTSANTQDALEYFEQAGKECKLIVIHASLDNTNVEELFKQLAEASNNTSTIFIGDSASIRSNTPKDLYKRNELNGILLLPPDNEEFKSTVRTALGWTEDTMMGQDIVEKENVDFLPMRMSNLYRFTVLPTNGYLEYSDTKYIKLINKDEAYSHGLVYRHIKKNFRYIYLEKSKYVQFLEETGKKLMGVMERKGLNTIYHYQAQITACTVMHEALRNIGVNDLINKLMMTTLESIAETALKQESMWKILSTFPINDNDVSEQAILSNYLCQVILANIEWSSDMAKKKLGLASILHDVAITNPKLLTILSLHDPEFEQLSQEDQTEFKEHPSKAGAMTDYFSGFQDAYYIVSEHHELPGKKGFPQGLSSFEITALSCVFVVANHLVIELLQQKITKNEIRTILKRLMGIYAEGNFKDPGKALGKILKAEFS
ncbi:MAG: hypothetical protein HN353_12115 [Bdellovibrionales bacterium]|nr:hypothetical protein [Bdellovibrionales bacterium]MBT3526159.1 hypothetical protein [Bdellovibrionales bacterium]MBT7668830.1 hypothetical protein [Bdellovibrionales bacterium]